VNCSTYSSCTLGECRVGWRSSTTLLILLGWRGDRWSSHKRPQQWACGPGCAPRATGGGAAGGACVRILPWPRARGSTAADTRTPPIASRRDRSPFDWQRGCGFVRVRVRLYACVCLCVYVCVRKIALASTGRRCVRVRLSACVCVCVFVSASRRRRRRDDATTAMTRIRDSWPQPPPRFYASFSLIVFLGAVPSVEVLQLFFSICVRSSHSAHRFQYLLYNIIYSWYRRQLVQVYGTPPSYIYIYYNIIKYECR